MTNQFIEFSIITYELLTEATLISLGVDKYAYILHDKDIEKKTHYHYYIKLFRKKTYGGVFNIISNNQPHCTNVNLIENIKNTPSFIRYLVHKDDLDKFQYDITNIIANFDIKPYFNLNISDDNFINDIINMIYNGQIIDFKSIVALSQLYGKIKLVMKYSYFFKSLL